LLIEPRAFRDVTAKVDSMLKGGLVEVVEHAVRGEVAQLSEMVGAATINNTAFETNPRREPTMPSQQVQDEQLPPDPDLPASSKKLLACNTCGGAFNDAAEHRAHFRCDWHRHNLKLKMVQKPPVSEQEFNESCLLGATS
jgi:hypothetical protein